MMSSTNHQSSIKTQRVTQKDDKIIAKGCQKKLCMMNFINHLRLRFVGGLGLKGGGRVGGSQRLGNVNTEYTEHWDTGADNIQHTT